MVFTDISLIHFCFFLNILIKTKTNKTKLYVNYIQKPVGTLKKAWWIRVRELKDVRRHCH